MFKAHKQQELHCMIVEILWRNPALKYYQVEYTLRDRECVREGERECVCVFCRECLIISNSRGFMIYALAFYSY